MFYTVFWELFTMKHSKEKNNCIIYMPKRYTNEQNLKGVYRSVATSVHLLF